MLKKVLLGGLAVVVLGLGIGYATLDKETRGVLAALPTNKDVLFWSIPQRDAAFRALDRLSFLAKARPIGKSETPYALPAGAPISIPGLDAYMAEQRTSGLVIIHDGKVRLEHYGLDFDAQGRWTSFSVAKSFTSTLVGAAIKDGFIKSLEDKVSTYIPDLKGSAYDDVTIRQLLTMTSGVGWNEDYEDPNADVAKFNNAAADPGVDATVSYMRKLPRAHPPGTHWAYNTGETNLIGVLVTSATKKTLARYLEEKIWKPFGMAGDATWLLNSTGSEIGGCCIQATTADYARFGQFVLNGGKIGDVQVVPEGWFAMATTKQVDIGEPGHGYGFQWWTNDDGTVAAQGIFGQGIFIDPARKLVIASNSNWTRANEGGEGDKREAFYKAVQGVIDGEAYMGRIERLEVRGKVILDTLPPAPKAK
jgi:CubicO group peptidase (beta-lactamase class C family)